MKESTCKRQVAHYGTWKSAITADIVSGRSIFLNEVHIDPSNQAIYLVEGRPFENGRCVITKHSQSSAIDILPLPYNARSKVHEYGGAACTISPTGQIIFTDFTSNGVFSIASGLVQPIIEGIPDVHYADFDVHPLRHGLILAIQEDRRLSPVQNRIVLINASGTGVTSVVAEGADFYSSPRFSRDGKRLCWTQWSHPDMPWTGSELHVAEFEVGTSPRSTHIAGQARCESICQPRWNEDGNLYFMSDRTGFWQLYCFESQGEMVRPIVISGFEGADLAGSEGTLGNHTYDFLTSDEIILTYTRNATNGLLLFNLTRDTCTELNSGLVDIQKNALRRISNTNFAVIGATTKSPTALYIIDIRNPANKVLVTSSTTFDFDESICSTAEHITFPSAQNRSHPTSAHAIFIHPKNPAYIPLPNTKPPLIVSLHGGPTSHITPSLSLATQYWTSRGYAYAHVNYAGSTGYGRAYRDSLNSNWGLIDAVDAASCVSFLVSKEKVDPSRVGIVGASAGGYGVLQALTLYPDIWAGGVSLYGIGDMKKLAGMMHKFESCYIPSLVFGERCLSRDEEDCIYRDRSPCFNAQKITAPVLFLQGSKDVVVPVSQAEDMAEVMRGAEKEVRLVVFEGEGHGFRREENLRRAIEEEEEWWRKTLVRLEE